MTRDATNDLDQPRIYPRMYGPIRQGTKYDQATKTSHIPTTLMYCELQAALKSRELLQPPPPPPEDPPVVATIQEPQCRANGNIQRNWVMNATTTRPKRNRRRLRERGRRGPRERERREKRFSHRIFLSEGSYGEHQHPFPVVQDTITTPEPPLPPVLAFAAPPPPPPVLAVPEVPPVDPVVLPAPPPPAPPEPPGPEEYNPPPPPPAYVTDAPLIELATPTPPLPETEAL